MYVLYLADIHGEKKKKIADAFIPYVSEAARKSYNARVAAERKQKQIEIRKGYVPCRNAMQAAILCVAMG